MHECCHFKYQASQTQMPTIKKTFENTVPFRVLSHGFPPHSPTHTHTNAHTHTHTQSILVAQY